METLKPESKTMAGANTAPARSRFSPPEVSKTKKPKAEIFIVIKEFCGIEAGTELKRYANSHNVKYMIENGYLKAK